MKGILLACLALWIAGHPVLAEGPMGNAAATWKRALGAKTLAAPSSQAGSVVVVCDDGSLKAYGASGTPFWTWDSGTRLLPAVTRSPEGTCYAMLTGGVLVAVNRSGRELWRRELADAASSASIVIGWDGRLFVATDSTLRCFTGAGFQLWKTALPGRPVKPLLLDSKGGVVLASENGKLFRSSPFGEASVADLPRPPLAFAPLFGPSPRGDEAADDVAVSFADGTLAAYSREGRSRTLARLQSPATELVSMDGRLAYGLRGGEVGLLNAGDGSLLWTGEVPQAEGGAFRVGAEGIYFLSRRGSAGFTFDGRRLWNIVIDGASAPPALGDDGLLYSGGEDWILYAYRVEERVRSDSASFFGPGYSGRYGLAAEATTEPSESAAAARIAEIRAAVVAREIGPKEPAFTLDLMEIAGGTRRNGNPIQARRRALPPHLREAALILLSRFASPETIPSLIDLFRKEGESAVRAAAAETIGAIGVDPGGRALRAFAEEILPTEALKDERLLASLATSIGALCRFSGPPLSDAGIPLLVSLAQDVRPPQVRERAAAELKNLAAR